MPTGAEGEGGGLSVRMKGMPFIPAHNTGRGTALWKGASRAGSNNVRREPLSKSRVKALGRRWNVSVELDWNPGDAHIY